MSASGTIYLTISALIYTIITTILFQRKKKINKLENKIFTKLLILSILSMVFELAIVFTVNISVYSIYCKYFRNKFYNTKNLFSVYNIMVIKIYRLYICNNSI